MKSLTMILAACAASSVMAITGSITTENATSKGTIKWSARNKAYVIQQGKIETTIPLADVVEMEIEKPENFDSLVATVGKGQGASVIPALKKIVDEYAHLQWDKAAGRWLAEAYITAGNADEALKACQAIIMTDEVAAYKGELAPAYWKALLAKGQNSKLESALKKAASSGDRFSSGAALNMRGDIILKNGNDTNDAHKQALTDGYLRVALLYTDAGVAAQLRPEALYKAAKSFEKLGQSGRADLFRTELKQKYPTSIWATK